MNSIINHLGSSINSTEDMINAFDSFMENGGQFEPIVTYTGRDSMYYIPPSSGNYIGYWYCKNSRDNSYCYIKVKIDVSQSTVTLLDTFKLEKGSSDYFVLEPFFNAQISMGLYWHYYGNVSGLYNTNLICGIHFKIS